MIRMSSIVGGIMVGYLVAWYMGIVNFGYMTGLPFVNIPIPFNYGFAFNWTAFIGVAFIYVITTIESTGDLTANFWISNHLRWIGSLDLESSFAEDRIIN